MTPFAPEIVAPLGAAGTSIRIRSTIVGATVEVTVTGTGGFTQTFPVKYPDAVYTLSTALAASQTVTATQTSGGVPSPASAEVIVQSAPTSLNALSVATVMNGCGRALWARGAAPGAEVKLYNGTQVAGSAQAVGDWVKIVGYDPPAQVGGTLRLEQTCNGLTASQTTAPAAVVSKAVPLPTVTQPLVPCQTSLTVGGVLGGAYVEMVRGTPPKSVLFAFGVPEETLWLEEELKPSEAIRVRQGFKCNKESPDLEISSDWVDVTVQPATTLVAPTLQSRPCPGSTHLTLGHLVAGARVVLTMNGADYEADAPDTRYTFTTPPLQGTLTAHQVLCGHDGPPLTIEVAKTGYAPTSVEVSDMYPCAAYVYIKIFSAEPPLDTPNYLFYLTNRSGQQISVQQHTMDKYGGALIPVNPSLVAGDQITVHVQGCGEAWKPFGPFPVEPGPPPPAVIASHVWAGQSQVDVLSNTAGALIDVYVQGTWAGSAISTGNLQNTFVPVDVTLGLGWPVYCTQTMCGVKSDPSPTGTVVKARPQEPVDPVPANGAVDVPVPVHFSWRDPGAGTVASADSYNLTVKQGGATVISQPGIMGTTHQATLALNTPFEWFVGAVNTGGSDQSPIPWTFTTAPPAQADVSLVPPIKPGNVSGTYTIDVKNSGTAAAPGGTYTVQFALTTATVPYQTVESANAAHVPLLGPGDTTQFSASLPIPSQYAGQTMRVTVALLKGSQTVGTAFLIV